MLVGEIWPDDAKLRKERYASFALNICLECNSVAQAGMGDTDMSCGRIIAGSFLLGRVDKPDPDAYAAEQDEAEKAGGRVIVSRGDTALVLQLAEEAFDACP